MEVSSEPSGEDVVPEKPLSSPKKSVPEASRRAAKTAAEPGGAAKRKVESRTGSSAGVGTVAARRSGLIGGSAGSVSAPRRNSTGGLSQKSSISVAGRKAGAESVAGGKSSVSSASEPIRKSLPELRRNSVTSSRAGAAANPVAASPVGSASRTSGTSKAEVARKPVSKLALSGSGSASSVSRRISSSSVDSTASSGGSARRTVSRVSSPTVSSGLKAGSLSTSQDRASALSGRRKGGTPDSRDSKFIALPHVEIKANDDLRLDLRGHRVRSLTASGLNLSSNLEGGRLISKPKTCDTKSVEETNRCGMTYSLPRIYCNDGLKPHEELLWQTELGDGPHEKKNPGKEGTYEPGSLLFLLQYSVSATIPHILQKFVYLRDNLLSTLEGVEILTRVKVLDLSFNDFKGPGFEPLENCRVLQFLSVAQNKLKSLTMASQPRLQVLAASKNKISTLKGFPYLPVLELRRLGQIFKPLAQSNLAKPDNPLGHKWGGTGQPASPRSTENTNTQPTKPVTTQKKQTRKGGLVIHTTTSTNDEALENEEGRCFESAENWSSWLLDCVGGEANVKAIGVSGSPILEAYIDALHFSTCFPSWARLARPILVGQPAQEPSLRRSPTLSGMSYLMWYLNLRLEVEELVRLFRIWVSHFLVRFLIAGFVLAWWLRGGARRFCWNGLVVDEGEEDENTNQITSKSRVKEIYGLNMIRGVRR
ncbi:hypothetical protein V8G54_008612 [Vigna mungo]|uniref:Uncharacterized protein n=1 Tax=Vigna mungo TaxID=3915 RepID=A0AAQ3P473_VIGMU